MTEPRRADARPGFNLPTGPVKPAESGTGIPDRFGRKSVEIGGNRSNSNSNLKSHVQLVPTGLPAGLTGLPVGLTGNRSNSNFFFLV